MMIAPQPKDRIEKLRNLINDYRYHYHVLDESTMSEAAADSLKHELSQLEAEYPELITPDSPTQRVAGQALDKFNKVTHRTRMISLSDVFDRSEIEAAEDPVAYRKLVEDRMMELADPWRTAEAFGVVTMGSVFPIIAVLLSGFLVAARRKSLELAESPGDAPRPLRRTSP